MARDAVPAACPGIEEMLAEDLTGWRAGGLRPMPSIFEKLI
jgi:hypothetical protein